MAKLEKYRLLIVMAGVGILLLILAAAVSGIQMQPGDPFPIEWKQPAPGAGGNLGTGNWILVLIRGFLLLCIITIPIYIFTNLLTPQGRKRLLKGFIQLLVLSMFMYIMLNLAESFSKRAVEQEVQQEPVAPGGDLGIDVGTAQAGEQEIAEPPAWLDAGICLGLAFILAILITVLAWGIYRATREGRNDAISRLAEEAQEAIDSIQAGKDIRDTIIRCYIQMTQVLAEERNVRREDAMTPHEFEQILLVKMRLPEGPVRKLTSLFEAVRYGDYHPGQREELEAIDSFTAIAAACRRGNA